MGAIHFKYNLDIKVTNIKTGFIGLVSMCAIQGNPENPEIVYFINGAEHSDWCAERLLKEVTE